MFATELKNKELVSKDAKCSHSSRLKKKEEERSRNTGKGLNGHFKEGIQMAIERMKRCSGAHLQKCQLKPR